MLIEFGIVAWINHPGVCSTPQIRYYSTYIVHVCVDLISCSKPSCPLFVRGHSTINQTSCGWVVWVVWVVHLTCTKSGLAIAYTCKRATSIVIIFGSIIHTEESCTYYVPEEVVAVSLYNALSLWGSSAKMRWAEKGEIPNILEYVVPPAPTTPSPPPHHPTLSLSPNSHPPIYTISKYSRVSF